MQSFEDIKILFHTIQYKLISLSSLEQKLAVLTNFLALLDT